MQSTSIRVLALLVASALLVGCQSSHGKGSSKGDPQAVVNPAAVQAKAKDPSPSPTCGHRGYIGRPPVTIKTANTVADKDPIWVESLDIDGDGKAEQTTLLWDEEDKVLFAYADADVLCSDGSKASVTMLVGVNGPRNSHGRPEGSGFYVVWFDANEGGAAMAGLYGARFNGAGKVTGSGAATIVDASDDIRFAGP
jgi:hypothetical protein